MSDLVADVGGYLGLILGVSVLDIVVWARAFLGASPGKKGLVKLV